MKFFDYEDWGYEHKGHKAKSCKYEKAMPYDYGTAANYIWQQTGVYQTAIAQTATVNDYVYFQTNYQVQAITTCTVNWVYNVKEETEEERAMREQRERDAAAKEAARNARAREALVTVLSQEQREQFEKDGQFELQVNDRLYRITPGQRVQRLDPATKKALSFFCIHPAHEHGLPSDDVAISQKLLLEANEKEFLRIANETVAA